jgi:cytochrome c5
MNTEAWVAGASSPGRKAARRTLAAIAAAFLAAGNPAQAQGADKSGKEVVAATCSGCHASGVNGAPKIGDKNAWAKLGAQGLTGLTEIALAGIRKMPPHGGNPALSDTELKRGVAYMVNQSGGRWIEPTNKAKPVPERTGEQVVRAQCSKCHLQGAGGAPRIGDKKAWIPRLRNGFEATVSSAINGHGAMPARGGLPNLTDAELRSAITYMFSKVEEPAAGK